LLPAVRYNKAMPSRLTIVLAALSCVLAIAACGSSSKPKHAAAAGGSGLAFASCMRSHGVPNFPDPSSGGGGIKISLGSGINPFSPAFKVAQSQCVKLLPGGGPAAHGVPSEEAKQQMLAVSKCMRAHGVSGFPDPTLSPPADAGVDSIAIGRGGVFLAVPRTIDTASPRFQSAASACRFGGR
jgi:hypothetical protein